MLLDALLAVLFSDGLLVFCVDVGVVVELLRLLLLLMLLPVYIRLSNFKLFVFVGFMLVLHNIIIGRRVFFVFFLQKTKLNCPSALLDFDPKARNYVRMVKYVRNSLFDWVSMGGGEII